MDILINNPIKISINTIEIDEHWPSLKLYISIDIEKSGFELKNVSEAWFECHVFDSFIKDLQLSKFAVFKDMNDNFKLEIDIKKNKMCWISLKKDINENISKSEGYERIDLDDRDNILNAFIAYPKWW